MTDVNFVGAYNSTKESLRRSREAQDRVDDTDDVIGRSEYTRYVHRLAFLFVYSFFKGSSAMFDIC